MRDRRHLAGGGEHDHERAAVPTVGRTTLATSNVLHFWVFGHLGMYDDEGQLVPDPSRRGWVPLRVLADAAHLTTTQRG